MTDLVNNETDLVNNEKEVCELITAYFNLSHSDVSDIKKLDLYLGVYVVCHSEGWDVKLSKAIFVCRYDVNIEMGGMFSGPVAERLSKALLTMEHVRNDESMAGASYPVFNIEECDNVPFNPNSNKISPELYRLFLTKMKSEMMGEKAPQYFFFDFYGNGSFVPVVFVRKGEESACIPYGGSVDFQHWPLKETETCYWCEEQYAADSVEAEEAFLYDSPDHKGETRKFCSAECYENCINASEFGFFTCDKCDRTICRQYKLNGYHSFERELPELEKTFCEACYDERMFKKGQSFLLGSNMHPETYSNHDLETNGFQKDSVASSDTLIEIARALINEGYVVIAVQNYFFGSCSYSPTPITIWKKAKASAAESASKKLKCF